MKKYKTKQIFLEEFSIDFIHNVEKIHKFICIKIKYNVFFYIRNVFICLY